MSSPDRPATGRPLAAWEALALVALACLLGLFMLEAKGTLYFDEIVHGARAETAEILDYSLRPVYLAVNYAIWHWVGPDYESLRIVSLLSFGMILLLVFQAVSLFHHRLLAWTAVAVAAGSETVLYHGLRGMAHVPTAAAAALAVYLLLRSEAEEPEAPRRARWIAFASGLAAILSVGFHPTMLAFVGALGLWGVGALALAALRARSLRPLWTNRWSAVVAGLVLGQAILVLAFQLEDGRSYFGSIFQGVEVVQTAENYRFYHAPWHFYFTDLTRDPTLFAAVIALAVSGVLAAALAMSRRPENRPDLGSPRPWMLLWVLVCTLGVWSLLTWKFDRVTAQIVPLLAVTAAVWMGHCFGARRWLQRGFVALVLVGLAVASVTSLRQTRDAILGANADVRLHFNQFDDVLRSVVRSERIGYLGDGGRHERLIFYIDAAGKELVLLDSRRHGTPEDLEREITERELTYVIVDYQAGSDPRTHSDWWEAGISSWSIENVYRHRDFYQLWQFVPKVTDPAFVQTMADIPAGTLLAVLGWPDELDPNPSAWVDQVVARSGLDDYRLSVRKAPHSQFWYVGSLGIRHVLLTPGFGPADDANYQEFRSLVQEADGRLLAEDAVTGAELWEVSP